MQATTGGLLSAFELIPRIALDLVTSAYSRHARSLETPSPWYVLMEVAGGAARPGTGRSALGDALEQGLVIDAIVAASEAQARALWRIRDSISESQKREGASIKHDISVPVASIPAFIEKATSAVTEKFPGARPVTFGHLGDGNLHFNFSAPAGQAMPSSWRNGTKCS